MSEHIRRVASPEGAKFYGLPIGAPITADVRAKAKALHGVSEPAGASKGSVNKGGSAAAATSAKAAVEKAASATPVKPKPTKNKVKKSSISGNLHFKVGKSDYTAPNGSQLFHQKGVDGLAYVKTPDGKVHIFNENGEIETDSKAVLQALSSKFSADLPADDPDFEAADFDKVGSHYGIDQMPVGGVLTDSRGNHVFTKNEDGTWHNEELGVDLDEKAVKPLFDSGDLIPEKTPTSEAMDGALADKEAVNLSELDYDSAVTAIDAMPEGTALQAGATVFTKGPDGWQSSDGGTPFQASTMAYAKNDLKPADGVDVTPDMAEDPKGAPAPKTSTPDVSKATPEVTDRAAASKQAIADANPNKPQPVNWESTYPGDQQYPQKTSESDLDNAQPGDTVLAAYYSPESGFDLNDYYDLAVFTKQDDGTWWDQDSIQKLSDLDMGDLSKDPDVGVYSNKDNKGPEVARQKAEAEKAAAKKAADEAAKKAAEESTVAPDTSPEGMVTGGSIKGDLNDLALGHKVALKFNGKTGKGLASKTVYTKTGPDTWSQDGDSTSFGDKTSQWLKGQKNKSTSLVHEAYPVETALSVEDDPKSWDSLQTGDSATGDWSKNVGMGSQVMISQKGVSGTYTKSAAGDWVGGGFSFNEEQMAFALDKIGTAGTGENAMSSVLKINPKGSLKKPESVDIPEPDVDLPSNDHTSVGGKPGSLEHLKEYPAATTLLYTKKDGTQSTYTKLDSGQYLTPAGQVLAPEKLNSAVKQGKFEVGSLPAVQAADTEGLDDKYLTPGAPIDKFGVLKQFPDGTVLSSNGLGKFESNSGLKLTKVDGAWTDQFGMDYPPDEFEADIKKSRLFFQSAPAKQVSEQEHSDAVTSGDYKTSDVPTLTFDSTGQAFSTQDVKGALDAFESFSGFQLKYAFKGDAKENPLASKTDEIKAWAKSAYPDLPPKAGAIKVFKDKLGITDVPGEEKNSVAGAPNISFGDTDTNIKTTATGLTGGEFNDQDVQQAIDILEAFNGKAFKNELNKKGNPLGALSPNHLVGFDKDKTVTKQKFIDLMKQKLQDHKDTQPADVPEVETPVVSSKDPEEVGDTFGLDNIEDMPKGMVFQESDAGLGDDSYIHVGDNLFESMDTGMQYDFYDMPDTQYTVLKKPEPSYEDSRIPEYEVEELADWEKELLYGADNEPALPANYEPHVSFPVQKSVGDPVKTEEEFDALPVGTKVTSDLGSGETKNADGSWSNADFPASSLSSSSMHALGNAGANWKIKHMPEDKPSTSTEKITPEDVDGYGVGTVLQSTDALTDTPWLYKKNADGTWYTDQTGITFKAEDIKKSVALDSEVQWSVHSEPNPLPEYATTPVAVSVHADEDGTGGPEFNASGLTVGKYSNGKGKAYMVVHADGTATYVTGTGSAKKITAAAVKKNHEAGMNVYGGIPDSVPEVGTKAPTKTPAVKQPEVNLPDGVYFLGGKNLNSTKVFQVEGDEVKVWGDKYTYNNSTNYGYAPESYGTQKQKLKTKFLNGQVTDADGDSIVPENHTGSVFVWNKATTIPALVSVKKALDNGEIENPLAYSDIHLLNQMGLPVSAQMLNQQAVNADLHSNHYLSYDLQYLSGAEAADNIQVQSAKKILSDKLDKMLAGVDMSEPEGNGTDSFTWNANGEAEFPNVGGAPTYLYGEAAELNAYMKKVQKEFGGPDVMLPAAMGKYDKANWILAFQEGNFGAMYKLEVAAAASKNKSHAKGYLHPGFPGNSETNKVTWAAKVKGENAPGNVPEGTWSEVDPSNWSTDEINNYLIAAHMQNPTYLSSEERRNWVMYHYKSKDSSYQKYVENLSLTAQERASKGVLVLTDPPVWTDDIKPAKEYDKVFESQGEFPTNWGIYSYSTSKSWASDNWSPELQQSLNEATADLGYPSSFYENKSSLDDYTDNIIETGVGKYFSKKKFEYEEGLKKPVYTTIKAIAAGSHDVYLVKDQFDRQYIFKPSDPGKEWRSEVEHMNVSLSKSFGFVTPGSQLIEHNGQKGQMQEFLPNSGNLLVQELADGTSVKFDLSNLSQKQASDVASEHVLDWILDNDDTHGENMLLTPNGGAVGIDKGRGLYVYGNWDGLALGTDYGTGANTNASVIFQKMYAKMIDGSISKEHMDAAYKAAMKAARRVQKQDDAKIADMIREGTKNRPKWGPPDYMTHFDHKQAPMNSEELVAAVLSRKANIAAQIDGMWDEIYAKAGHSKPEQPVKALGEDHLSGWSEADLSEKVEASKAFGASAVHASAAINGTSLMWTESLGNTPITKGEMKIGSISQQKILNFLQPKATGGKSALPSQNISNFPTLYLNGLKSYMSHAGKDVTKNAIDKNYDPDIQSAFDTATANIDKDLDAWSPNMPVNGVGMHDFPSGAAVPEGALLQYKQALQHYKAQSVKVQAAKDSGESTSKGDFTIFTPTASFPQGQNYVKESTGESYMQLADKSYLHHDGESITTVGAVPDDVKNSSDWTALNVPEVADKGTVAITLSGAGDYDGSVDSKGNKTVSETWNENGHHGQEYEVTLPSGEKIWFRNSSSTGTFKTQQGMLRFQLSNDDTREVSLARVESYLNEMGLNTEGADEESAESVYWRQMFGRVLLSKGGGTKIEAARSKLKGMKYDLQKTLSEQGYTADLDEFTLPEAIGLAYTPQEERQFWTELASDTYGADKVTDWINNGGHLPQYNHLNLEDTEAATGKAYFKRIDVDVDKLQKNGTMVAIGNNGKDTALLNYISTGGMLSTEERLRIIGKFKTGASSEADQNSGGASGVFGRVANGGAEFTGSIFGSHVAYWNPSVFEQVGTYAYDGDEYGNTSLLTHRNNYDPFQSLKFTGTSNEVLTQNNLSIFDHLEMMIFEDAQKRDEAIQRLKEMNLEMLRGLPIEERLVLRTNYKAAYDKIKNHMKTWSA